MVTAQPSREQIKKRLLDLLSGRASREEVAGWADALYSDMDSEILDPAVLTALEELAGADLRTSPDEFLHSDRDFHAWLDALEQAAPSDPE